MSSSAAKMHNRPPVHRVPVASAYRCSHGFHAPLCVVCHAPTHALKKRAPADRPILGRKTGNFTVTNTTPNEDRELDYELTCGGCGEKRVITRRYFRIIEKSGALKCFTCKPTHPGARPRRRTRSGANR